MKSGTRSELYLLLVTFFWGGTFIATKMALPGIPPLMLLGLRFALSLPFLLILSAKRVMQITQKLLLHGILLGIVVSGGYGFQTVGLQFTTAGRSALITYFFALLVPFLQRPFTGKALHRGNILGLAIVIVGLSVLNRSALSGGALNPGDLLALGSAVSFTFFIIFLDIFTRKGDLHLLTLVQFFTTSLISLCASFLWEHPFLHIDPRVLWSLLYLVLPGTLISLLLMNRFQKEVTPVKAVIIYAMEPVFAIFLGIILLHEYMGALDWLGTLMMLGGVILSDILGKKENI